MESQTWTASLRQVICIHMPQHIEMMESGVKIRHRMDGVGHKYWLLTGAAVPTFYEPELYFKNILQIFSWRSIYLFIV